ncbi:MAG: peptidyl-prolyl cis-trans isomerase [Sphingosinicella sp.]
MSAPTYLRGIPDNMLSAVRRSARSWAAAAILFIALFAIVITGFGTGGMGGLGGFNTGRGGEMLASAGSETLTEQDVTELLNRQYARVREQQPDLTFAAFLAEAFDPIVDQLVLAVAVQAFGQAQGLSVSQEQVDREIVRIPAFRDVAGRFDQNVFRQQLQAQNITEAQLREDIAQQLLQRQLLGPVARGVSIPDALAREYANLLLERRRGSIASVPTAALAAGMAPGDAEIAAYYQRHRARFTIPERRVLRYAMIGAEQVAGTARATDQEIAAFYQRNQARYAPGETRDLQQIVLPSQAAAQRFVQQVRTGTSFTAAAGQAGFAPADIAVNGQSQQQFAQVTSAELARAAFAGQPGAVIGPVRSPLGFHVVRVERINRPAARPLAAVRDEIARTIEQSKRVNALNDLVTRIEERLSDGTSLEEVARAERLSLASTPPVTAAGQVPGQAATTLPAELRRLIDSGFDIDADEPEPLIEEIERNRHYALIALERLIPAAAPPLAQIRDQVRAALIAQRALERARTTAQTIVASINRGTPLAQAISLAGVPLPAPQDVNMLRREMSSGQDVAPPLAVLFSLPAGRAFAVPAPGGAGWYVVFHAERTPGDAGNTPEAIAATRTSFSQSGGEEIAQQFARSLEQASGLQRYPEAIARLKQRLISTAIE